MDTPRIDHEIEIGCLFGMVHASVCGDSYGAHVEIDGNVIWGGNLRPLPTSDPVEVARCVRAEALRAIRLAHAEIGVEFTGFADNAARQLIARALPLTPILEAQILEEALDALVSRQTIRVTVSATDSAGGLLSGTEEATVIFLQRSKRNPGFLQIDRGGATQYVPESALIL